jgi:hypothetical protein
MSLGICVAAAPNSQIHSPLHYKARLKSLSKLMWDYGGIPGEYDREPLFLFDEPARQPLYFRAMAGDESVRPAFKQIIAADPTDYAAYLTYLTLGNKTITRKQFNHENSVLSKELVHSPHDQILLTRIALLWANGDNILVIPSGRGQNVVLDSSPQPGAYFMSHVVAVTRRALANSGHFAQPILVLQLQVMDGILNNQSVTEPCDQKSINGLIFRYGGSVMYGQYIKAVRHRFQDSLPALSKGAVPNVRALVSVLIGQQLQWVRYEGQTEIDYEKKIGIHPLPVAVYKRATRFYREWIAKLVSKYHIDLKGTYYSLLNEDN